MEIKIYKKFDFYQKRDLLYKLSVNNVYQMPKLKFGLLSQKKEKNSNEVYSLITSSILLFDNLPKLLTIKKTNDKKIKGMMLGTQTSLSPYHCFNFLNRYLMEEKLSTIKNTLIIKNSLTISSNIFDEFLQIYEQFTVLPLLQLNLFFFNCQNNEQRKVIISSWFR